MDILLLVVLFLGVATAGVTQVVAGTGVRLIIPPLAILACGHAEGLRIALTLGLLISVVTFLGERGDVPFRPFTSLALPIALSAPLWVLLIGLIPHEIAARLAGLVAVVAVVVTLKGVRTGRLVGRPGTIGAGVAASGLFALGGVGGPVLGVYARDNDWPEPRARGVVNACIALAQVMVLGLMGFPTATKPGFAVGLAALGVGLVLGGLAVKKLPKLTVKLARTIAIAVAAVAAAVLLVAGTLA
ncbi:hypothetical protein [Granulicoccus sp. GXG6511]|uniref:hypothetical protein n=1 Tax=Granulicoccus sp. GXG6511 TaxID=3381351 RepID=UPI003D7DFC52